MSLRIAASFVVNVARSVCRVSWICKLVDDGEADVLATSLVLLPEAWLVPLACPSLLLLLLLNILLVLVVVPPLLVLPPSSAPDAIDDPEP